MKRIYLLLIVFFIGLFLSVLHKPTVETDILKAVLKPNAQSEILLDINRHSNSDINVIFESDTSDNLKKQSDSFIKEIKENNLGDIISSDNAEYLSLLNKHPKVFLTYKTRNLLLNKEYEKVAQNSMNLLYNPIGIPLVSVDKDPYLFVTDYVTSNFHGYVFDSDKFYSILKIRPHDTGKIISLSKNYDAYLSGTPVHSYKTAQKSNFQINLFCFIATIFVIWLCHYVFNSYKIFFPIMLSILFGFASGYIVTTLTFHTLHVLTMVFATTLIGIGIDYSIHYYSHKTHDKLFYKNLSSAMLTTVIAFLLLLIPNIPLLNQISIYTIGGLIGVYLFVITVFPYLPFESGRVRENIPLFKIDKKKFYIVVFSIIMLGSFFLKTDDSIKNLYKPDKTLFKAEQINQRLTNPQNKDVSFIVVNSLVEEEKVTDILNKYNVEYLCRTKFVPSSVRQKENIRLVNDLYRNNLNSYAAFLTPSQKQNLITQNNSPIECFVLKSFYLESNKSFIIAYNLKKDILNSLKDIQIVNIQKDVSQTLFQCRKNIEPIIPLLFAALLGFLYLLYKRAAFKILIPPLLGVLISISVSQLFGISINIFTILTIFLIIGFTIDYSIFKSNGGRQSDIAVFAACLSTVFSFFLLSFTSFKLISSLGILLSVGIAASYISSCVLFDDTEKI